MTRTNHRIIVLLACAVLVSCFEAGPAHPERDGSAHLRSEGHPPAFVEAVVKGEQLEPAKVDELSKSRSADVRFLVARNPNLAPKELELFIEDKSDFVRSGAARNHSLSPQQFETLLADNSHTVLAGLAANASLSDDLLLRVRAESDVELLFFATNPNCPATIRQEIETSGDALAKRWLKTVDGWKADGTLARGEDGRWLQPVTVVEDF